VNKRFFKLLAVARHSRPGSYLSKAGWFDSYVERMPVNAEGEPIPLMTYPAVEFLAQRVPAKSAVFEYGAGNSTVWWAPRVKRLEVVEHDEVWYERVRAQGPDHVRMHLIPLVRGGAYCRKILDEQGAFDVVVIDGRDRVHCVRNAVQALKPSGVIVWDDSRRDRYQVGMTELLRQGFRRLPFTGLNAVSARLKETSIFYRSDNVLGICSGGEARIRAPGIDGSLQAG
jgi:hypothetical protein